MINYFYIIILLVACTYSIIHNIYLFNKGKYNPYLFGKATNKQAIFNFGLFLPVLWSFYNLLFNTKPPFINILVPFIVYSFCFTLCTTILNYLSYRNSKNHKIIYHTIIFNVSVIAVCIYMTNMYLHSPSNR